MSTSWGYVCQSHNPNQYSEDWFNHGQDLLTDVYRRVRAGEWPTDEDDDPVPVVHRGHETRAPVYWLRGHPHCMIALWNEYGVVVSLDPDPAPMVPDDVADIVMAHNLPFTRRATMHPIESIRSLLATDSRDWGEDRGDAWLWGIVMGWDDEDLECSAMELIARKHDWDEATVARLRLLHERFKATLPVSE